MKEEQQGIVGGGQIRQDLVEHCKDFDFDCE